MHGERLDDAENVHVDVHGCGECTEEVDDRVTRYWEFGGKEQVGDGEGKGKPGVAAATQQQFVLEGDGFRVDDQQDALDPAFALLDEVEQGEWGFLPHLS